ncbi:MotA/TolQ/ExbB proton channel family protein [Sabulilitoribacter arenilitoris]|uniref:MotA/TolQ/ExbB proton channel family protein n=1 Tax=Wocania arenilitoris TaxID=2044858 RepID=A0AAE3EM49_9FLAO|nr:MotA/TolQ/ExbB proton channel family protein [Wocania arenilitoris]MCF7567946.1 MotA/TolQ/ExbB proton channel family protein [Wocania arenilitoris]
MNTFILLQDRGFFSTLVQRFNEGGPFFMSLILICFMLAFVFLGFGFFNLKKNLNKSKKMRSLASDTSILGLVFGFLGSTIGMINAFDSYEVFGDIDARMMAGGLKVSFLTTVFGCLTFILPRIVILVLRGMQKE